MLKNILLTLLILGMLTLANIHISQAEEPRACTIPIYTTLNQYLNSFQTLQANFIQNEEPLVDYESGSPNQQSGVFYIAKPGKLRWEYQQPRSHLLILNSGVVSYYDASLDEVSHLPSQQISEAIEMLANPNIKLENYKILKECTATSEEIVILAKGKDNRGLIIIFNRHPLSLREIATLDDSNTIINEIYLKNIQYNPKLDSKLFELKDKGFFDDE